MLNKSMLRLGLALMLFSGLLILKGGQELYKSLRFTQPQTVSYDEFVKLSPQQGWFRITDCAYDMTDMVTRSQRGDFDVAPGKVFKIYLPVQSAGSDLNHAPVSLVLERNDDEALTIAAKLRGLSRGAEPDAKRWLQENASHLHFSGTIEGTVQFGVDGLIDIRDRIQRNTNLPLASPSIILTNGEKPNPGSGLLMLGGGAGLLFLVFLMARPKPEPANEDNWQYPLD